MTEGKIFLIVTLFFSLALSLFFLSSYRSMIYDENDQVIMGIFVITLLLGSISRLPYFLTGVFWSGL